MIGKLRRGALSAARRGGPGECQIGLTGIDRARRLYGRGVLTQEAADERDVLNADAVGEEPEMADACERNRERMEKESAEELVGMKGHDFGLGGIAVIFPAEGHMGIGDLSQSVVRNGDAVGVAPEITKDMVGPAKGGFGVDDPVGGTEAVDKRGECLRIC